MIVLLGASGYVGSALRRLLEQKNEPFCAVSRDQVRYTEYGPLVEYLKSVRPKFLINAAGYTGKPNVDACELARAETLHGNALFPLTVSHACRTAGVPWGHVSSGCIYTGAIVDDGVRRIEPNLMLPSVCAIVAQKPNAIHGFRETDEPNFSFRRPPCSFYSGSKALAEEALAEDDHVYLWRLRIPFDRIDSPRNFLSKLQRYPKIYDNVNSISHLDDFARAAYDLWRCGAPYGIYNITNPGWVTSRQIADLIRRKLDPNREFHFWENDAEFYRSAVTTPRSNCVLDCSKLLATGVHMRHVDEALDDSLSHWHQEPTV